MSRRLPGLLFAAAWALGCTTASPPPPDPVPRLVLEAHPNETHAVAFSPNGSTIATAGDSATPGQDEIALWSAITGQRRLNFPDYRGVATCLAYAPDGSVLAVGSRDGRIALMDAESGAERISFRGRAARIYCLAFSFDGKVLASVAHAEGDPQVEVTRWDVGRGVPRDTLTPAGGPPFALSPQGAVLAWPTPGRPAGIRVLDLDTHAERLLSKVDVRRDDVLAFSPDGKWVAAVHQEDWSPFPNRCPYLYLINARNGRIRLRSPRPFGSRMGLAISHDAKLLVRGVEAATEIWDLVTFEFRSTVGLGESGSLGGDLLMFSPDDRTLLTTDGHGGVLLWEVSRLLEVGQELSHGRASWPIVAGVRLGG